MAEDTILKANTAKNKLVRDNLTMVKPTRDNIAKDSLDKGNTAKGNTVKDNMAKDNIAKVKMVRVIISKDIILILDNMYLMVRMVKTNKGKYQVTYSEIANNPVLMETVLE